jgi:hypothetical protein
MVTVPVWLVVCGQTTKTGGILKNVLESCPSYGIFKDTTFQKLNLVQSSNEKVEGIYCGPLERSNLNHWTT